MQIPDWFKRHILPDSWEKPAHEKENGKRILVVDDKAHIRRLIEVNLSRQGYCVDIADSGDDALDALLSDNYSLFILGSSLPDLSFSDMLSALKADMDTQNIPVICLLADRQEVNTFNMWRSGIDCFLTKPFNPMELIAFTRRIFRDLEDMRGEPFYTSV